MNFVKTPITSRRHWLTICGTIVTAGFAGCATDDSNNNGPSTEPTNEDGDVPHDDDPPLDDGDVSVTVQPSSDVITYGDDYAVDITVHNRQDEPVFFYGAIATRDQSAQWTTLYRDEVFQLSSGEERTETRSLAPPATGNLEFGYMDTTTGVALTQWNLAVDPPETIFSNSNRFYDGLAVSVDLETRDTFEMPVENGNGREIRSISAPEGQIWIQAHIRIENTNDTGTVGFRHIHDPEFFLNANGIQQPQYDRTISGRDAEFIDQLPVTPSVRISDIDGFFAPTSDISAGGVYEGWRLFTSPKSVVLEDLEFVLMRDESSSSDSIGARWSST